MLEATGHWRLFADTIATVASVDPSSTTITSTGSSRVACRSR
jgi:hypothetical protein